MSENEGSSVAAQSGGRGTLAVSKDMLYGVVIIVLAALLALSILTAGFGIQKVPVQGNQSNDLKLPDLELKLKVQDYINKNLLSDGYLSEVTKIEPYDKYLSLATVNILKDGEVLDATQVYVNNDGKSLIIGKVFDTTINLNKTTTSSTTTSQTTTPDKTAKPKAQVFVMAFCPYGLQFLKAYTPVMELLGSKADLEVRFVSYAMHGKNELDANNYLYCAQKNEPAKFTSYLRCFVAGGDYQTCVATAGLNNNTMQACVAQVDSQYNITGMYNDASTWLSGRYPQYPVDAALNNQYGVQGSPTFVINGKVVSTGRNAEAVKQAICAAFTEAPAECQTTLSSSEEAPGLGAVGSGTTQSGSTSSCGG